MKYHFFSRGLIVAIVLSCSSSGVSAAECFSEAASVKKGFDIFEPVNATRLTKQQHNLLRIVLRRLTGTWHGRADSVECDGEKDDYTARKSSYQAEVVIRKDPPQGIDIMSHLYSKKEKKRVRDDLQLYLSLNSLSITETNKVGDLAILGLAKNFMVFHRKFNRRNASGERIAQAVVRSFAFYKSSLMVEFLEYNNGLLSRKMTWELRKK